MNYRVVISVVLLGLAAVFLAQNADVVQIRLLFWTLSMSRALVVFFGLLIGFLAGWVLHGYWRHRSGRQVQTRVTRR